jgi:hypothetical protein
MTPDVADVLAGLLNEQAALLQPGDIPSSWTPREHDTYEQKRQLLAYRIRGIQESVPMLAAIEPQLAADAEWHERLDRWRKKLADELLSLPNPIRAAEDRGRLHNLRLSISVIDRGLDVLAGSMYMLVTLRLGVLMQEDGFVPTPATDGRAYGELRWLGSQPEVSARIEKLLQRQFQAQSRLDDALLSDDERAARDAAAARRVAELNALPRRITRGDGSQYEKHPDGSVVEIG